MEVESALVDHPKVAESAVIGKQHEIKGQAICTLVSLKAGVDGSNTLVDELRGHVAKKIGPIARPDEILFAAELPKTRSGKIIRRLQDLAGDFFFISSSWSERGPKGERSRPGPR